MMKKLSLILLSSAFVTVGFAQSTEAKTEPKKTQEFKAQPVKVKNSKIESKLESDTKTIEYKEVKIQNKALLLRKEELNAGAEDKKEAVEIQDKKKITPSKN